MLCFFLCAAVPCVVSLLVSYLVAYACAVRQLVELRISGRLDTVARVVQTQESTCTEATQQHIGGGLVRLCIACVRCVCAWCAWCAWWACCCVLLCFVVLCCVVTWVAARVAHARGWEEQHIRQRDHMLTCTKRPRQNTLHKHTKHTKHKAHKAHTHTHTQTCKFQGERSCTRDQALVSYSACALCLLLVLMLVVTLYCRSIMLGCTAARMMFAPVSVPASVERVLRVRARQRRTKLIHIRGRRRRGKLAHSTKKHKATQQSNTEATQQHKQIRHTPNKQAEAHMKDTANNQDTTYHRT